MQGKLNESFASLKPDRLARAIDVAARTAPDEFNSMVLASLHVPSYLYMSWQDGASLAIRTRDGETYVIEGKPE
jgi:hypothetical protein